MKPSTRLFFGTLSAGALWVGATHSAELVKGQGFNIASQNHSSAPKNGGTYHISLTKGKVGMAANNFWTIDQVDGSAFSVAFTEPVQGYRFATANPANKISTAASKGVSISMASTDTAFYSNDSPNAHIWVTGDPGADLGKPATPPDLQAGIMDINNVTGSIDISGLASGTVYFFYGAYRCIPTITACMIDKDGSAPVELVLDFHNGDRANNSEHYMSSLTFVNDAGHDTIEYDLAAQTGRWSGIVVTGKAMP